MAAYLCTISRESPGNWRLCKEAGMWGVPFTHNPTRQPVEVGDRLLIWLGGRGYVAEAIVTEQPRSPRDRDEAPWPGGTYRFQMVVPMKVVTEVRTPIHMPFVGDRQTNTDLSKAMFRRSFARVPDEVLLHVRAALTARALEERDSATFTG